MRFAVINPLGVNRPFPHHFRNACLASSLLIAKGITFSGSLAPLKVIPFACLASSLLIAKGITFRGAKEPDKRSPSTTPASQKLHVVAVVSASVMTTAPQFSQ